MLAVRHIAQESGDRGTWELDVPAVSGIMLLHEVGTNYT